MSDSDELTKIVVDLSNHGATGGESMWARALGEWEDAGFLENDLRGARAGEF